MTKNISWQQRTAEHKKAAVLEILHRPASESENVAIPRVAKKYNGRNLPEGKKLRLSKSTLRRLWYSWKADPSDKVFNLHYPEGQRVSMAPWVIELLESYAMQHGCTIRELQLQLRAADPGFPFSKDSLYRHLPPDTRQRIAAISKLHRKQKTTTKTMDINHLDNAAEKAGLSVAEFTELALYWAMCQMEESEWPDESPQDVLCEYREKRGTLPALGIVIGVAGNGSIQDQELEEISKSLGLSREEMPSFCIRQISGPIHMTFVKRSRHGKSPSPRIPPRPNTRCIPSCTGYFPAL